MLGTRRFVLSGAAGVAVLLAAATLLAPPATAVSGTGGDTPGVQPIELTLSAGDGHFDAGEPIVVEASVTNRDDGGCDLIESPEPALQILSISHDATSVTPSFELVAYNDGLGQSLRRTSRDVAPGESLSFPLVSHPSPDDAEAALQTVVPRRGGGGVMSLWPVAEPGTYELEAQYAVPNAPGIDRCTGTSNLASVHFTVGPTTASTEDGTGLSPLWLIAAVLVGALAALVIFVTVRRHRRAAATTAVMLLLASVMPALPFMTSRADAKITPLLGEANPEVRACLTRLAEVDPWKFMPALNAPVLDPGIQIVGTMDSRSELFNDPSHPYYAQGIGDTSSVGMTIRFDWTVEDSGFEFEDGVPWDNCASLYHELAHVVLLLTDESSDDECKNAPILADEFKALVAENEYRRAVGLPERTVYDVAIPATCEEDDDPDDEDEGNKEGEPGSGQGSGSGNGSGPGGGGGGGERPGGGGSPGPGGSGPAGESGGGARGPGRRSGGSHGEPHLITHDGRLYDFQAVGEFVLTSSDEDELQVQVRQAPFADSRSVAMNSAVAASIAGRRVSFAIDDRTDISVRIDGEAAIPEERGSVDLGEGATLTRRESYDRTFGVDGYTLAWPDGSTLWVDGMSMISDFGLRIYLDLADERTGAVSGLLGDFDGDPVNDLAPRNGDAIELDASTPPPRDVLYEQVGDSWRVDATESLFDYDEGESTANFTDQDFPEEEVSVDRLPAEARSNADEICQALSVSDPAILDACILDVATTGQGAYAVSASEVQRVNGSIPSGSATQEPGVDTTEPESPPSTEGAPDVSPGDTVEGRIDEPGTLAVHRFTASAGDVAYFEADPDCDPGETGLGWAVQSVENIGTPYGILNAQASVCTDIGRTRFPEDGDYAVVIDSGPDQATGEYRFTWVETPPDSSEPLELGTEVSGELALGERQAWVFDAVSDREYALRASDSCEGYLGYQIQTIEQFETGYWGGASPNICDDQDGITLETRRYAVVVTRYSTGDSSEYSFVLE